MYQAKAGGRGRIELFNVAMREDADRRIRLARELRGAIGKGQLLLEYQPTVELGDRAPRGDGGARALEPPGTGPAVAGPVRAHGRGRGAVRRARRMGARDRLRGVLAVAPRGPDDPRPRVGQRVARAVGDASLCATRDRPPDPPFDLPVEPLHRDRRVAVAGQLVRARLPGVVAIVGDRDRAGRLRDPALVARPSRATAHRDGEDRPFGRRPPGRATAPGRGDRGDPGHGGRARVSPSSPGPSRPRPSSTSFERSVAGSSRATRSRLPCQPTRCRTTCGASASLLPASSRQPAGPAPVPVPLGPYHRLMDATRLAATGVDRRRSSRVSASGRRRRRARRGGVRVRLGRLAAGDTTKPSTPAST